MSTGQTILHHGLLIVGTLLVVLGLPHAFAAPVGQWRYRRKSRAVLRQLIRHHERMERAA